MQTGNLLGQPFNDYVRDQIKTRQKIHGKKSERTLEEIQYLNSRNAWIKLASGVSLEQGRLDLLKINGNPMLNGVTKGNDLAQKNILFNGITSIKHNEEGIKEIMDDTRLSRQDILEDIWGNFSGKKGITYQGYNHRSGINGTNRAYGVGGTDFGYSPMPGIIDMDFKCLNRGSIKKASLTIKAHNKNQFDIIDVLYLRLGYSVFLEWGYDKYIDNDGNLQNMQSTLIDHEFWKDKYNDSNYDQWLPLIEDKREETKGNYDGIFGTISNFSWTFNNDGSYDIKVEIISLGDIIESLKVNLPSLGEKKDEFKDLQFTQQEEKYGISKEFFKTYPDLVKAVDEWVDNEENYLYYQYKYNHKNTIVDDEDIIKEDNNNKLNPEKSVNEKLKNKLFLHQNFDKGAKAFVMSSPTPSFDVYESTTIAPTILYIHLRTAFLSSFNLDKRIYIDELGYYLLPISEIDKTEWKKNFYIRLITRNSFEGEIIREEGVEEVSEFQQQLEDELDKKDLNRVFEYFYDIKYTFFGIGEDLIKLDIDQELLDREHNEDTIEEIKKGKVDLKRLQLNKIRKKLIEKKINTDSSRGSSIFLQRELAGVTLNPSLLTKTSSEYWRKTVGYPKYEKQTDTSDIIHLDLQPDNLSYFIRLGTFLDFIQDVLIPKVGGSKTVGLIKIDTDIDNNICYVIDNMVSNDIRKCLISNPNFYNGSEKHSRIFTGGINEFIVSEGGFKYGKIMNTYINFSVIEEIFETTDEKDSVSLYKALKSICDIINECLGDVNNLEPIITDTNTIKIIDQTPIPGIKTIAKKLGIDHSPDNEAILEVFGYSNNTSNFVHNIGLTTEISKNYATMITIGATSNGSIPGAEATAFSKWNVDIKDRFKNQVTDAVANPDDSLRKQNEEVLTNYNSFIKSKTLISGLNEKEGHEYSINEDQIKLNKPTISNYYKYAQAESSKEGSLESSIGFLPFNLKIDMDGIGGIKIYNKVKINTKFLPSNYPETLDFIITGVNHKLSGNDWTTSLETIATATSKLTK
jgi:hypothetical protein